VLDDDVFGILTLIFCALALVGVFVVLTLLVLTLEKLALFRLVPPTTLAFLVLTAVLPFSAGDFRPLMLLVLVFGDVLGLPTPPLLLLFLLAGRFVIFFVPLITSSSSSSSSAIFLSLSKSPVYEEVVATPII